MVWWQDIGVEVAVYLARYNEAQKRIDELKSLEGGFFFSAKLVGEG